MFFTSLLLTFSYENGNERVEFETPQRFNFRRTNFERLNELLVNINFDHIFSASSNLDNMLLNFYITIFKCFSKCVPFTRHKQPTSSPPWYTPELRYLRNLRHKLWEKHLISRANTDFSNYMITYTTFSDLSKSLYSNYIDQMQSDIISDPKLAVHQLKKIRWLPSNPHISRALLK